MYLEKILFYIYQNNTLGFHFIILKYFSEGLREQVGKKIP